VGRKLLFYAPVAAVMITLFALLPSWREPLALFLIIDAVFACLAWFGRNYRPNAE
jgi:hypothetical protein